MNTALRSEEEQTLLAMLDDKNISTEYIIQYTQDNCKDINLGGTALGKLFERISGAEYDEENPIGCFTAPILITDLVKIHPGFRTTNGCQWARSDTSYLGKKYVVKRQHEKGSVHSIKLDGANDKSLKRNRAIDKKIQQEITSQRCAVLDIGAQIECDHKDGHYDVLSNQSTETQKISDFQPLSKAVNDAKRTHCNRCKSTGKRFDATHLGYSVGFIAGDEDTIGCQGCYWYDPQYFNKVISGQYQKRG